MFLSELQLFNFKNHKTLNLQLNSKIIGIYGLNGVGKTNILDAIYMLSCLKSNFNSIDNQLIHHNQNYFSVKGWFNTDKSTELLLKFDENHKKSISHNGKKHKRLIDHIGYLPAVFICPYDISLVLELADERRKFIDITIGQVSTDYLNKLALYKKVLTNRNAFLKNNEGQMIDPILLQSYNDRLIETGTQLHGIRNQFIIELNKQFQTAYTQLSNNSETIQINYISQLNNQSFEQLLTQNLRRDIAAQRTTAGIHKDDIEIQINGMSLRKFGSQGQIKSTTIALKLAQFHYLSSKTNKQPILLLDDIFEKIDLQRANNLMQMISQPAFGQIVISDTEMQRMKSFLGVLPISVQYIEITNER